MLKLFVPWIERIMCSRGLVANVELAGTYMIHKRQPRTLAVTMVKLESNVHPTVAVLDHAFEQSLTLQAKLHACMARTRHKLGHGGMHKRTRPERKRDQMSARERW